MPPFTSPLIVCCRHVSVLPWILYKFNCFARYLPLRLTNRNRRVLTNGQYIFGIIFPLNVRVYIEDHSPHFRQPPVILLPIFWDEIVIIGFLRFSCDLLVRPSGAELQCDRSWALGVPTYGFSKFRQTQSPEFCNPISCHPWMSFIGVVHYPSVVALSAFVLRNATGLWCSQTFPYSLRSVVGRLGNDSKLATDTTERRLRRASTMLEILSVPWPTDALWLVNLTGATY